VKKDFHIWVSDKERFIPEQGMGLDIVLDKNKYEPGSNVAVAIASKIENRDVLMDIERDFVHRFEVLHIDGNTKNINIDLEEADTPSIRISVSSFADDRLDTAQEEIKISANSKKLDIDISTDKEVYAPGDTVTVDVSTKDQDGNPQSSDVALWAVDKALFELVPQNNHDIHGAYWDHRPGYTNETNSLRGIWIQMAEGGGCFLPETQVLMDDGETKNIEDIREGEHILTFGENENNLVQAQVIKTHSAVVDGYLTINNTLRVTDNHIVWVNNAWKRAGDMRIGDRMRGTNGQEVIVEDISWQAGRQQVYNLIVENVHTYIADGYYVHNGKDGGMRTLFKDVAYWNPRVRTGDSGTAQVTFELPDDLTTWVISAIGATKETIVGDATSEIRTTKAAIIRPQMPNILRKGDEAVVVASAHNNTSKNHEFIATLELSKGEINDARQKINIPAGESRVVMWSVSPEYADEVIGFTYTLTATDDEKINDSVYKEVPIEQFGFWQTDSVAHTGVESYNVKINNDARNDKTSVELTIASTIMSSLSGAMNYLIHYPYGCMEQTTSAFMPAVLAKENPGFFVEALEGKDINEIIETGIARLTDKQNPDGGWSWWGGNSDVFLSAYVSEYLLRAQIVGADVDGVVLEKAHRYFDQTGQGTDSIIFAYGKSLFEENYNLPEIVVTSDINSDLVAMAVIANVRNGYTNKATNGYDVLVSQLQEHGNVSYWPAGAKERFGSIDASSGIGLRAFLV
ncbi:MAG: alpha-2-macroglobulin family protein, partial [Patescibacteria group bacterium]|nr:alpha-2-macroglobulin family protein [Patescibacteria group bacterium]